MDIALKWNADEGRADLGIEGGDMALDAGLTTAVLLSAFCDRRADKGDVGPCEDPRGWWADRLAASAADAWGSKLWIYARAKRTPETLLGIRRSLEEAFRWLVEDGHASKVEVEAEYFGDAGVAWTAAVHQPAGNVETYRFERFWKGA